jgi:TATA-binding protein-associated factor
VNVYRLVTSGSIEEKMMEVQKIKLAMSNAIINTDNSTMFSMGTDKMLDLFNTSNTKQDAGESKEGQVEDDYSNLNVQQFLSTL